MTWSRSQRVAARRQPGPVQVGLRMWMRWRRDGLGRYPRDSRVWAQSRVSSVAKVSPRSQSGTGVVRGGPGVARGRGRWGRLVGPGGQDLPGPGRSPGPDRGPDGLPRAPGPWRAQAWATARPAGSVRVTHHRLPGLRASVAGEGGGVLGVQWAVARDIARGLGPAEPRGQRHGQVHAAAQTRTGSTVRAHRARWAGRPVASLARGKARRGQARGRPAVPGSRVPAGWPESRWR